MYFDNPASWTSTSASSYRSKSLTGYTGRFRGFFASFFGFAGASPPSTSVADGGLSPAKGSGVDGDAASVGAASVLFEASGGSGSSITSPDRLLLPPAHELVQGNLVSLNDLVANPRDDSVRGAPAPADPFDEDLVVFVDEVDRSVADGEGGDLSSVLDELDLHALAERGVRLFRLDGHLLEDDSATLRCALERVGPFLRS